MVVHIENLHAVDHSETKSASWSVRDQRTMPSKDKSPVAKPCTADGALEGPLKTVLGQHAVPKPNCQNLRRVMGGIFTEFYLPSSL